jgi:hypothetical protein
MATKYTLTTAFTAITETSGTIQNVGNESVELASSTNAVAGEGIVLNPGEKRSFKGALSARSIGDAGADVNVVDFTEAGEGGEEYDLPIASDTTLGGIKISNSFTVANDGTLSIKKSGKTILGAVKSSDDEGKVAVNNDGTMTYNPLGYRQPSTTYEVGDIKYHSALPTGYYLECTTAGTSGSGDLTISSPSVSGTVTDGTARWLINKVLSANGGALINSSEQNYTLFTTNDNGGIVLRGGTGYRKGALLALFGKDNTNAGRFMLSADNGTNGIDLIGQTDTSLIWDGNDLAGSAIVAKSLGANGYIKYASGLIVQWGRKNTVLNKGFQDVPLSISFSANYTYHVSFVNDGYIATGLDGNDSKLQFIPVKISDGSSIYDGTYLVSYIAIGY